MQPKITRLGLPDLVLMRCKKCKQTFHCNLQCIPQLKEYRYTVTAHARESNRLCVCWHCDESIEEWKSLCNKDSGIDLDKVS